MQDKRDLTIKELAKDCRTIEDVHEMLKNLFRDTIQQLFEAKMDDHWAMRNIVPMAIIREIVGMGIAKQSSVIQKFVCPVTEMVNLNLTL